MTKETLKSFMKSKWYKDRQKELMKPETCANCGHVDIDHSYVPGEIYNDDLDCDKCSCMKFKAHTSRGEIRMTGTFICECGFVTRDIKEFNKHSCKKFKPSVPDSLRSNSPQTCVKQSKQSDETSNPNVMDEDTPEETKGEMATSEGLLGENPKSSGTQSLTGLTLKGSNQGCGKEIFINNNHVYTCGKIDYMLDENVYPNSVFLCPDCKKQGFDLSTKMFYVKLPNDFMVSRKDVREFIKKIKEDFKNKNKMHDWEVDEIIDALAGADLK